MSDSPSLHDMNFHTDASSADNDGPANTHVDISHNIRSPMNVVLSLAGLLELSQPLTDRQKDYVRTLKVSVATLRDQVNTLLESNGLTPIASPQSDTAPELPHPAPRNVPTRPRVLLVDDYPPNVLVVATYLEKFGYDYDIADNGLEAVSLAKANRYVACLMDVQMHEMDGIEATMAIRDFESQERQPHLPIIGVTAHALSGDRERCLDAGMDAYVAKPFNPSELEARLTAIVAT